MQILFFAQAREATGTARVSWDNCGPVATDELWEKLLRDFPALEVHRSSIRIARNGAFATRDEIFEDWDEVALIPPVSGG